MFYKNNGSIYSKSDTDKYLKTATRPRHFNVILSRFPSTNSLFESSEIYMSRTVNTLSPDLTGIPSYTSRRPVKKAALLRRLSQLYSKNPRLIIKARLTLTITSEGISPILSLRRHLSRVRICSSSTTESLGKPYSFAPSSI